MTSVLASNRGEHPALDAILVPSGGLVDDLPSPLFASRLDAAAELHRSRGGLLFVLGGSTIHKDPPLDAQGLPIHESTAGARYLVARHGIDPDAVVADTWSQDTIGNAYVARIMADLLASRRLAVVTSALHATRTKWVFGHIFGLSPQPDGDSYSMEFLEAPDTGPDADSLVALAGKEAASLTKVMGRVGPLATWDEFRRWIFLEHGIYSVNHPEEQPVLPPEVLNAY